jgi:predicted Zn-dependent protease
VQKELRREPGAGGDEELLMPFLSLKFTPAHEKTADAIAYSIYLKAGWDPTRFTDVYKRLEQTPLDGLDPQAVRQLTQVPRQPPAEARNWGQPPVADDARFAQLQSETRAVVGAMRQDEKARLLLAALPNCLGPEDSPTQAAARQQLFPPPQGPSENKWNKGLQGAR